MKKDRSRQVSGRSRPGFRFPRVLAVTIAVSLVILALCAVLVDHVRHLACFRVSGILVRDGGKINPALQERFGYLRGLNIFDLDVKRQARIVSGQNPQYKMIRFTKLLPDQIVVDFVRRTPLALIDTSRPMVVDEQQVLFEPEPGTVQPQLPVITGLSRKLPALFSGWRCTQPEMTLALEIIIKAKRWLPGYHLVRVDVSGAASASMFIALAPQTPSGTPGPAMANGSGRLLEVRIGSEDITARLKTLATVLAQVRQNIYTILYIDLRFKEPVIKFQERT